MVLEIYDADGRGRVSLGRLRGELLLATRHSSRDSRSQVVVQFALILLVGQFFKTDPLPEFKRVALEKCHQRLKPTAATKTNDMKVAANVPAKMLSDAR